LTKISTAAPTRMWAVSGGKVRPGVLDAAVLGLPRPVPGALRGGDAARNAVVARQVLGGVTGPVRDAVLVNAGAAIASYRGLDGDLTDAAAAGLHEASNALDSGAAKAVLDRWIAVAASADDIL
jgi:anthranilate phosphoribosyltransferase